MRTSTVPTLGVGQLNIVSDIPGAAGNTSAFVHITLHRRVQANSVQEKPSY